MDYLIAAAVVIIILLLAVIAFSALGIALAVMAREQREQGKKKGNYSRVKSFVFNAKFSNLALVLG